MSWLSLLIIIIILLLLFDYNLMNDIGQETTLVPWWSDRARDILGSHGTRLLERINSIGETK